MDTLIIVITVIIVLIMAYILSRPFLTTPAQEGEAAPVDGEEERYQALLEEIQTLQNETLPFGTTIDRENLIEEKKQLAADLLRRQAQTQNPTLENQPPCEDPKTL